MTDDDLDKGTAKVAFMVSWIIKCCIQGPNIHETNLLLTTFFVLTEGIAEVSKMLSTELLWQSYRKLVLPSQN